MVLSLVLLSVLASSLVYDSTVNEVLRKYDDVMHLSMANNWARDDPFSSRTFPLNPVTETTEVMISHVPITPDSFGWPPLYYILIGKTNEFLSPDHVFLFNQVSYINIFIISLLDIALFFFIRRYFGNNIAFITTLFFCASYVFIWHSVHISPRTLSYLLIVIAFIFLKKKTSNYILFSIFLALAHLTHVLAVLPFISYVVFLIFYREFKGALIVGSIYTLILTPMFVQNWFEFGDFGRHFGIPFSDKISELFGSTIKFPKTESFSSDLSFTDFIFQVSSQFQNLFMNAFEILLIIGIISVILFFIRCLLKFNSLEYLTYVDKNKKRLFLYAFVHIIITTVVYFWMSSNLDYIPNIRYVFPIFFLLIPIGIFVIINSINSKFSLKRNSSKILIVFIIGSLLLFTFYDMNQSISKINNFHILASVYSHNSEDQKTHDWIISNIPNNSFVISDNPKILFVGTGLDVISLPIDYYESIDVFNNYYQPEYLVVYDQKLENIKNIFVDTDKYSFLPLYQNQIPNSNYNMVFQIISYE